MRYIQSITLSLFTYHLHLGIVAAFSSSNNNNGQKHIPPLPQTSRDILRQSSSAIRHAFTIDGINHQCIRLPLSESMYADKEEGFVADRAIGWQGGPQETLRFLEPLMTSLLKEVNLVPPLDDGDDGGTVRKNDGGLPPRIQSQTILDFDGTALLTAESPNGALYDIQALLQANTDSYYMDLISKLEEQFSDTPGKSKRLLLLANSAWRDASSWGFWGAKKAQKMILDCYEVTYALDQFIVRGEKVCLLKVWPYDWCVYCSKMKYGDVKEEKSESVWLGSFEERPTYSQMEELMLQRPSL